MPQNKNGINNLTSSRLSIPKKYARLGLLLLVLLLAYTFVEPFWLEVKEIYVDDENIPAGFEGFSIVFITDIHHGPFFSKERVGNLVERINKLKPDIILLGGDYIHRDAKYIEPCFEELKNLKAAYGKFGVLGNHDHWEDGELVRESMKNAGITALDNQAQWIYRKGERIKIGGVGDIYTDLQDINPTICDVEENDFVILLSHNPDYAEEITNNKIDLVLSGHTHGGQVTFFGLWAPLVPSSYKQKYRTGVISTEYTKVVVSNGVGTITPPVRFFARPQILLIHLK